MTKDRAFERAFQLCEHYRDTIERIRDYVNGSSEPESQEVYSMAVEALFHLPKSANSNGDGDG